MENIIKKHNLVFENYIDDPRFGPAQLYTNENKDQRYIIIEKNIKNDIDYNELTITLNKLLNKNFKKIINLIDYEFEGNKLFCLFSNYTINIDNVEFDLYTYKKLILDSIDILEFMQNNNLNFDSLNKNMIHFCQKKKMFILVHPIIINLKANNNYLYHLEFKNKLLKLNNKYNKVKANIFSFGLLLLELLLNEDISNIYNCNSNIFNYDILNSYLYKLRDLYSNEPMIYSVLKHMLEIDESDMLDAVNLKTYTKNNLFDKNYSFFINKQLFYSDYDNNNISRNVNTEKNNSKFTNYYKRTEQDNKELVIKGEIKAIKLKSMGVKINCIDNYENNFIDNNRQYYVNNKNPLFIPFNYNDENYKNYILKEAKKHVNNDNLNDVKYVGNCDFNKIKDFGENVYIKISEPKFNRISPNKLREKNYLLTSEYKAN